MLQRTLLRRADTTQSLLRDVVNRPTRSGILTRWFYRKGFGIITDAVGREYLYLPHLLATADTATSSSSSSHTHNNHHQSAIGQQETPPPPLPWITDVGARVMFHYQQQQERWIAVHVEREPLGHRDTLVDLVIKTMADPQWEQCVTVREASQSSWIAEHRQDEAARRKQQQQQGGTEDDASYVSHQHAQSLPVRREDLIQRQEALHVFEALTHPMQQYRLDAERISLFH